MASCEGSANRSQPLTREQVAHLYQTTPDHLHPVLDAIGALRLSVFYLGPGEQLDAASLTQARRRLLILGEDTEPGSAVGPHGFDGPTLDSVFASAKAVVIHAAAPEARHYAFASASAVSGGQAVLIETQPAKVTAWLRAIGIRAPSATTLVISPDVGRYSAQGGAA